MRVCSRSSWPLVDEDDGRRLPAGLLEQVAQVAHTGRTHADEHLDKL
ncbi:hypothetical protein BN131_2723 [Cronobacter malonaticus 681]|nr:hypothetical protein BN131_2723 [Cronobacter malonaticus 681]